MPTPRVQHAPGVEPVEAGQREAGRRPPALGQHSHIHHPAAAQVGQPHQWGEQASKLLRAH